MALAEVRTPQIEDYEGQETRLGSDIQFEVTSIEDAVARFGEHWAPDYRIFHDNPAEAQRQLLRKIDDVASIIGAPEDEVEQSRAFIDRCFEDWSSDEPLEGYGSFIFMVPTRAERGNGFAPEFVPFIPLIDKLGSSAAQLLLVGLPPFIVDKYQEDENDHSGAMMFAAIFADMAKDITDFGELAETFKANISDAVTFARDKLQAKSVGLGAILPGLTNFGRDITVEGIEATTGHGGTSVNIDGAIRGGVHEGKIDEVRGIIADGLGAIGGPNVVVMRHNFPDVPIAIIDSNPLKIPKTLEGVERLGLDTRNIIVGRSLEELLRDPRYNVGVFAVTSEVMLPPDIDLRDMLLVDDSQPTALDPEQVRRAGGTLVWPISRDKTPGGVMTRTNFDYNFTGPARKDENWGCELEAAVVGRPGGRPDLALRAPLTPEYVLRLSEYLTSHAIADPAPLQSFGRYV